MGDKESLHSVYMQIKNFKEKLSAIEEQKTIQRTKEYVSRIEDKLEHFSNLIKTINDLQDKINNKKTAIVVKIPEKSISRNNNSLQLAHIYHEDFLNIIRSKKKIEEFIRNNITRENGNTDLKFIVNDLKDLNSFWKTQFFEQYCEYRTTKGVSENIGQIKEIDKTDNDETTVFDKTDSDLGCYPNENVSESNSLLEFAASSPIFKDKLEP